MSDISLMKAQSESKRIGESKMKNGNMYKYCLTGDIVWGCNKQGFFLLEVFQNGSWAHTAFFSILPGLFLGDTATGA